ncbi:MULTISPECIES: hypothetical protein [Anaerococcus]|uniref:hypothetical protein n=1 Tax=Anaerococcus TaxID=165779 RepID=UPI0015F32744|nr:MULTISPECIES: hypothetical protein [Anaerococcus]MDU2353413.1 hypothetical protein [Anaerococcus sp.]MDU2566095.1 hypothetical protein [Anaerococcus sp.]
MDRKNLRLIIGGIWIIVAIIEFSRNQIPFALLAIIVGLLFILMGVKSTAENENKNGKY